MTNKAKIGLLILLVIIAGGFIFFRNAKKADEAWKSYPLDTTPGFAVDDEIEKNNPTQTTTSTTGTTTSTQPQAKSYTMVEVKLHSNAQSCWTTISGNVYDVTAWINQHPGGPDKILGLCGKDGTQAFLGQHSGDRRPEQELKSFLIGVLK